VVNSVPFVPSVGTPYRFTISTNPAFSSARI
jgi:hypothetical protein